MYFVDMKVLVCTVVNYVLYYCSIYIDKGTMYFVDITVSLMSSVLSTVDMKVSRYSMQGSQQSF